MDLDLALWIAAYVVYTPSLFYFLWRQTRYPHQKKPPTPKRLKGDLTLDSDTTGMVM